MQLLHELNVEISQLVGIYRVAPVPKEGYRAINLVALTFRDFVIQTDR